MARNGKSISVKIPTVKVIEALQISLNNKKAYKETYKAEKQKFDKALAKWEKDVAGLVKSTAKATNVRVSQKSHWRPEEGYEVTMTFEVLHTDVPEKPEAPESINDWQLKEQIEEIENAIRILKMTEEEVISTSTYNSVARYL